jgi:thioredoxin/glutathione reductase (selenoprotein)
MGRWWWAILLFASSPEAFKLNAVVNASGGPGQLTVRLRGGGNVLSRVEVALRRAMDEAEMEDVIASKPQLGGSTPELDAVRRRRMEGLTGAQPSLRASTPQLRRMDLKKHSYDYDMIVIGGGSGGLAAAKEAASLGARVAVCDFVTPTPIGTEWGLGGTCVNVGCIPKKLMHRAAHLKEALLDADAYGWNVSGRLEHNWAKMVNSVQDHIASLNFGYRTELRSANVTYINALAAFDDEHTVVLTDKKGAKKKATAASFLIAVGGRPKYPDIPGDRECCITSDDLFSLSKPPGRTLVVGASYVALECAGFLTALNFDTTVMMRSIPLRGFDSECAGKIVEHMEEHGTRFIRGCVPTKFERLPSGKVRVTWSQGKDAPDEHGEFDTVLLAIGRYALTAQLNLDKVGVEVNKHSLKIVNPRDMHSTVGDTEQSTCAHIFAVGDVLEGRPELTPVAIKAGQRLAQRLFSTGAGLLMDYNSIATTVFTPIEYGCVGWSEEEAEKELGADGLEVFHSLYTPLEWAPPSEQAPAPRAGRSSSSTCFAKVLVAKALEDRVVGIHLVGDHAGEIVQGFALAVKHKISKQDLDDLVGIHPTSAEVLTTLTVTKRSGVELKMSGC